MPPQSTCHGGACRLLDLAVGLLDLGYAPVPLGADKVPLLKWAQFHVNPPAVEQLFRWWPDPWSEARGVGVVTGRPHGLAVVDADDADSWAWALANLPAVRGVKTRRGGHLHFRHPARGIAGNRSGDKAVVVEGHRFDVKGLGGLATAPYSLHPSGQLYQPLGGWLRHVRDLPVLPDCIRVQAEDQPPRHPRAGPSGRHFQVEGTPARAVAAYLAKRGGIPAEGHGSDGAVFRAASWCKANVPDLTAADFTTAIRREQPGFDEAWIVEKWRAAKGCR